MLNTDHSSKYVKAVTLIGINLPERKLSDVFIGGIFCMNSEIYTRLFLTAT